MEKFWTLLFSIEILMYLICTVYFCFYECLNFKILENLMEFDNEHNVNLTKLAPI